MCYPVCIEPNKRHPQVTGIKGRYTQGTYFGNKRVVRAEGSLRGDGISFHFNQSSVCKKTGGETGREANQGHRTEVSGEGPARESRADLAVHKGVTWTCRNFEGLMPRPTRTCRPTARGLLRSKQSAFYPACWAATIRTRNPTLKATCALRQVPLGPSPHPSASCWCRDTGSTTPTHDAPYPPGGTLHPSDHQLPHLRGRLRDPPDI